MATTIGISGLGLRNTLRRGDGAIESIKGTTEGVGAWMSRVSHAIRGMGRSVINSKPAGALSKR